MWIEGHTSVNPLIHTELEYLREEKEKGTKGTSDRYKTTITRKIIIIPPTRTAHHIKFCMTVTI